MLDRIAFVIGESLIALRRNFSIGFAAVTTTAVSLYLLAGMFYVGDRASQFLETDLPGQFQMKVNLKPGTTYWGITSTATSIRAIKGVRDVVWLPRKNQWQRWQKQNPELTAGYGFDDNIFPDSFNVRLNDLNQSDAVAKGIKALPTVDPDRGLDYFGAAQKTVGQWLRVGRNLSYWVGGLLFAVSGILILNAIRMTAESRRVEIRIMRLVGASRIVVTLPFALEGLIQGAVGGALATAGLYGSQRIVEHRLTEFAMGVSLAAFPVVPYLLVLCAIGGGYGGVCSVFALRSPMRARDRA